MNLLLTIAVLFIIAVIALWLFWKFDKEPEPIVEEYEDLPPPREPIISQSTKTLVEQIQETNKEFLEQVKNIDDEHIEEPVKIPTFDDVSMFSQHQDKGPMKMEKEIPFTGYDRRKLGMMQDSEMIESDGKEGLMTKRAYSIAKNKIEPRMTLALRMNPELIDSWKQANKGPTVDQSKIVFNGIKNKTGVDLDKK